MIVNKLNSILAKQCLVTLGMVLLVMMGSVEAAEKTRSRDDAVPNIVYISVDGVNRDVLYALLKKNKLPNLLTISRSGNYRNMSTLPFQRHSDGYTTLLSGNPWVNSIPRDRLLFDQVKLVYPKTKTALIASLPNALESTSILQLLGDTSANIDFLATEKVRNSTDVAAMVNTFIESTKTDPFVLFFNLTDVEKVGHAYRAGSQRYSQSIIACDAAIGSILKTVQTIERETIFLITTSFGFKPNSQDYLGHDEAWVLASRPIRYSGSQHDIVPTLFRFLTIPKPYYLLGKKLVY